MTAPGAPEHPWLLDLTHTSHTLARTGVQRVTRSLHTALGASVIPVTHDPFGEAWRQLETWEQAWVASSGAPGKKRGAHWPWQARVKGYWQKLTKSQPALPGSRGLIVPEIFSNDVARALPSLFSQVSGPRVAIFHDAIALKYPELTPAKTVGRFPAYLVELLSFDGIAAVSEDSRQSLLAYWDWLGVADTPPVIALPLGIDPPAVAFPPRQTAEQRPIILCVGTVEGRKNHLSLLEACDLLWEKGLDFNLHIIGHAQTQTGRRALEKIDALKHAGRTLNYEGAVDETTLEQAYQSCTFTVYPSQVEGFGLPVLESLARGKPCVCSNRGALGESAAGGGCVALSSVTPAALGAAIEELLTQPARLPILTAETKARKFKTWTHYAEELVKWMEVLPRKKT